MKVLISGRGVNLRTRESDCSHPEVTWLLLPSKQAWLYDIMLGFVYEEGPDIGSTPTGSRHLALAFFL